MRLEGIDTMIASFPLNKVHNELRDLRSPNYDKAIWILDSFFSNCGVTLMINWATDLRRIVIRVN